MIVAFQDLFGMQYEGGANWLAVTLHALGHLPQPPQCLILGASAQLLPESLRKAHHVKAVPLERTRQSRSGRILSGIKRRVTRQAWEDKAITRVGEQYNVGLWVGFSGFEGLGPDRPLLVWFPDFQCRYLPEMFTPEEINGRERQWDYVARRADGILAISQSVANDALASHPQISEKLFVCPFPPLLDKSQLQLVPDAVRRKYSLPEHFLLVCNQFWSHKNHHLVLEALQHILAEKGNPPVVAFTGRPHDYRNPDAFSDLLRYVHANGLHEYCRFLGVLPRSEQVALIRAANAVIQPSAFEGRGAIVEEAFMLGTQVLCSDLPVHRELRAPGTIFFPVDGTTELKELMQRRFPASTKSAENIARDCREMLADYGESFLAVCNRVLHRSSAQATATKTYELSTTEG